MNLTRQELREWQYDGFVNSIKGQLPSFIDDVGFCLTTTNTLSFRYKNGSGLVFPDNGYLGEQPGGKNYYPLVRLSPSYSEDCRFAVTCEPHLNIIAASIKESWRKFTT